MDPWADDGGGHDAGPGWTAAEETTLPTSTLAPSSKQEHASVDPWAESSHSVAESRRLEEEEEPRRLENTFETSTTPLGSKDFDPWGGGAPSMMTLQRTVSNHSSEIRQSEHRQEAADEVEGEAWQSEATYSPALKGRERAEGGGSDKEDEREVKSEPLDEPASVVVDEDDPWGSGQQARRLKAEQDAQAAAQQMEILRLQDEAAGKGASEAADMQENDEDENAAKEPSEEEKKDEGKEEKVASAATGWRSFFSRGPVPKISETSAQSSDAKASDDPTARPSTEEKESGRTSMSMPAPKLWQAPSLRPGHKRDSSNTSQGSGGKSSVVVSQTTSGTAAAKQGPGWEVATKKQTNTSTGGFMSGFLGQGKDGTTSGSTLSRFGQSLQRPPVISASDPDPDDSGDVEETGIEWDAGNSFDFDKESKVPARGNAPDLLGDEQPSQESTVSRFLGKWRGRQTSSDVKGKGEVSGDDLAWLENVGGSAGGESSGTTAQKQSQEDDWLAFVESKPDNTMQRTTSAIPKVDGKMTLPVFTRKPQPTQSSTSASLQAPPRISAPPQRSQTRMTSNTTNFSSVSPDPDDSFGVFEGNRADSNPTSYRDEPDGNNEALLRQGIAQQQTFSQQAQKKKQASFLSGFAARPVKPYTFDDDDDEEEVHHDQWSAFKDTPNVDYTPRVSLRTNATSSPPIPSQQQQPVRQTSLTRQAPTLTQKQPSLSNQPPSRTSTPGSAQSGFLPPPPSSSRPHNVVSPPPPSNRISTPDVAAPISPATKAPPKALSKGNTLTNDDLSFFENL